MLSEALFSPVQFATDISSAGRIKAQRHFDFIIVNSPLADGFGTDFAIDSGEAKNTVVLQLVRAELYEEIYEKNSAYGVFTLPKPISKQSMLNALHWMITTKSKVARLESKAVSIEDKMQEIRLVNKAKWLLIDKGKMAEPDAHRHIEKEAMDRCVSKRVVAEEIIKKYS
ncbi:MAG: ANTAR domain-containing protein [Clostridia bacterium]|nr:ANTAR domain-containing protein [Clostridia bacterium]